MKVYTRLVLNWDFEVLEESSHSYEGPVALCGGSSGGGGSSGSVDYPGYMKDAHKKYLDEMYKLLPAPNPFVDQNAPNIDRLWDNQSVFYLQSYLQQRLDQVRTMPINADISICFQEPQFYAQLMQVVCFVLEYCEANHDVPVPQELVYELTLLQDRLNDLGLITDIADLTEYEGSILPRYHAGMRDINAVQMSTFVVGKAVLESTYAAKTLETRERLKNEVWQLHAQTAKALTDMRLEVGKTDQARIQGILAIVSQLMGTGGTVAGHIDALKVQLETALGTLRTELMKLRETSFGHLDTLVDGSYAKDIELSRMQIVAAFEESNVNIDYDEKQYRWDLENYQYLANMLAGIGSGTTTAGGRQTSKFASALGGGLSGAAAGAMAGASMGAGGGPIGAGVGAIIGIGASLL